MHGMGQSLLLELIGDSPSDHFIHHQAVHKKTNIVQFIHSFTTCLQNNQMVVDCDFILTIMAFVTSQGFSGRSFNKGHLTIFMSTLCPTL
jgi:hypothetical protein